MNLLVVDHDAIEPLSQSMYRALAAWDNINMRLLIPDFWFDNYAMRKGIAVPFSGNFEVIPLPAWPRTRTHRMVHRGIGRQISEFQPDILFVNSEPENFSTFACMLMARNRPATRLVFSTWRNIDYARAGFPYRLSAVHSLVEGAVLRRADHAIAFTAEALPIFARLGFTRMTHIPPAVDSAVFSPGARTARESAETFTVGYAGRLHKLKGVDILLGAMAGLPRDFRLLVVGAGPQERELRKQASSLGIDNRVEWRIPVPRARMPDVLREMDVLVLPSRTGTGWKEQFGRVLVEAMACGVPVIGSDSGAIPSVIQNAGIVVPEGDLAGLRDAVLRVRNNHPERATYIERGLARVRSEFSVPVVAERYRRLMKSILNKTSHLLDV